MKFGFENVENIVEKGFPTMFSKAFFLMVVKSRFVKLCCLVKIELIGWLYWGLTPL